VEGSTILLTGPPRSGTTLSCELLGALPDTVALDEPMGRAYLAGKTAVQPAAPTGVFRRAMTRIEGRRTPGVRASTSPVRLEDVADRVQGFAVDTRRSALTRGVVRTNSVDGAVVGSKVSDEKDENGIRQRLTEIGDVPIGKPLSDDFTLVIKQCGGFTAPLEVLTRNFPVFALVRNPLSLLLSWQAVPMPIREGRLPVAESLRPDLAEALNGIDDRIDRQFYILSWFFGEFEQFLPRASVIRYEDIVATGGSALGKVVPEAESLQRSLSDRNSNRPPGEDHDLLRRLGERLLATNGPLWDFYERETVSDLLAQISSMGTEGSAT
jgi:hypothetical protein